MRRYLSLILVLVLVLTVVTFPVGAQEKNEFSVVVGSTTAKAGEYNVAVDVMLQNNPGIAGFSFCVNYDASVLSLSKTELLASDGYPVVASLDDHCVNVAWASKSSYSADGKIATLYFNVASDAEPGNADIQIFYRDKYDSFYQFVNGEEQDVSVATVNGCVQVKGETEKQKLMVCAAKVDVSSGVTDVIVPISLLNNPGLSGFSFCVNYDISRLELLSADVLLKNGYKVVSYPEGYAVCFAWTDSTNYNQNSAIAQLHFSVKSNAPQGKADINILFRDGYDSFYVTRDKQEVDVECDVDDGYVNVLYSNTSTSGTTSQSSFSSTTSNTSMTSQNSTNSSETSVSQSGTIPSETVPSQSGSVSQTSATQTTPSGTSSTNKTIVYTFVDEDGNTVLVYSDGTTEVIPKPSESNSGTNPTASNTNGSTSPTKVVSYSFVNEDGDTVIVYTDGTIEVIPKATTNPTKTVLRTFTNENGDTVIVYSDGTVEIIPKSTVSSETADSTQPGSKILGDANGDGAVNMKDVLTLRKHLADMPVNIDLEASDVNVDDTVNMKDVLMLRKYLADMIDKLGA